MNDQQAAIRINLMTKELEIRGSEEFLKNLDRQHILVLMELMTKMAVPTSASGTQFPTSVAPNYEHLVVNEASDEVDREYLRRFMEGYNNSFEKKLPGNDTKNHTVMMEVQNSTQNMDLKNSNLYVSLPKNMNATNKALAIAYELQTANANGYFTQQELLTALKNYQPKKNIPNDFLTFYIESNLIEQQDKGKYAITPSGIIQLKNIGVLGK